MRKVRPSADLRQALRVEEGPGTPVVGGELQADTVPRLMRSTSQINGKLYHVRHCGRENGQDVEKVYGPDIPIMALMVLLSETKFGSRSLKLRIDDHGNQRWNLVRGIGKCVQGDVLFSSFSLGIQDGIIFMRASRVTKPSHNKVEP